MKKIFIIILCFLFLGGISVSATETYLLNEDMITIKSTLDDLHYKASENNKLSKKDMAKLNQIRAYADNNRKDTNTNFVPIFYKLGNTYKSLGMKDDAIYCYRVIAKHYPRTVMGKKAIVELKHYGETQTDEYGRTTVKPLEDEDY